MLMRVCMQICIVPVCVCMYVCDVHVFKHMSCAGEAEAHRANSGEVGAELDLGGDGTSTPASSAAGKASKDGDPALAIAGMIPFLCQAASGIVTVLPAPCMSTGF